MVDQPISLYAATKKSNELLAYSYSHLYNFATTGLRFFTVYGPWGRPDMAYYLFADSILKNKKIDVFNNGKMKRDFTYVDDITSSLIPILEDNLLNRDKYKIYNIGNNNPVELLDFIKTLEIFLNKKAIINYLPMQQGDVTQTYANIDDLKKDYNYSPKININEGLKLFSDWFLDYNELNK